MSFTFTEDSCRSHGGRAIGPLALFVGAMLPLIGSCGHLAVARRRGPGITTDGIAISLLYSSCDEGDDSVQAGMSGDSESAYVGADALDLRLEVEVSNRRAEPVTINPKGLRLVLPTGLVRPIDSSEPESLPPGAARVLELHFWKYGAVPCRSSMMLAFDHLATVGPQPLRLDPLVLARGVSD